MTDSNIKAETKAAAKPARRIATKAATARKTTATTAYKHWPDGSSAYNNVRGDVRAVLICAAFVVAGYAKLSKDNVAKAGKGNRALFVELVGSRAYDHHRGEKRISDGALTAEGAKWFQQRISNTDRYKLTAEIVAAMQKGGKAGGLTFSHKVTA